MTVDMHNPSGTFGLVHDRAVQDACVGAVIECNTATAR